MEAINELGLTIPADLSLICFDDLDWMKFVGPGISAASQPVHELGKAAAELLLGRINGNAEPAFHRVLPVQFIERGSVQPPGMRAYSRAAAR